MDELRRPANDIEWRAYHDIRRHVLFERRGRGGVYNQDHPDELRAGHYPLILWSDAEAVGVIRVDIDADVAVFRRVAVREDVQRLGHGRRLLTQAEQFARNRGCSRVDSHVDIGAIGFYERCGFHRLAAAAPHAETVLMRKLLIDVTQLHDDYIAAWKRDDRDAAMAFWAEEILLHAPGSNPHSGSFRGKQDVQRNLIDRIYAETTKAAVLKLIDRAVGSHHVFTIVHERFEKADGRVFETQRVVIYRWANSKIVEIHYFDPDQAAADAFWAD